MGTAGGLDGDAGLSEDPDVATRGPLRDTQPLGELARLHAGAGLEDLQGPQGACGGAEIGRHPSRLGRSRNEPEVERPDCVLA